jgi:hypothetical protein
MEISSWTRRTNLALDSALGDIDGMAERSWKGRPEKVPTKDI